VPRTSFSDSDFRNLHGFRSEIRRFLHFSEETAREVGLEPQQHQLLLAVKAAPEGHLRVTDIASTLYIRHHSAVELVDRTIKQGLVRRERSEFDRREVNVLLTPHGEEILGQLSANHRAELRRSGPALVAALESILEGRASDVAAAR
jgi:DNA-binding MarR family transcriptional regulator